MIRILLLDEEESVREGFQSLLESESDIEVVGAVSGVYAALFSIEYIDLDIIIISREIAESDDFAVVKQIQQRYPEVKIIIFSNQVDESNFVQSLELGVEGYILDNIYVDDIKDVIRYVNKGFTHVGNTVLETIVLPKLSESCSTVGVKEREPEKSLIRLENKFLFQPFPKNYNSPKLLIQDELDRENSGDATEAEKAIAYYQKALELVPKTAVAYNLLGKMQRQQGDKEGAIKSYRRALELSPRSYDIHITLGHTLSQVGRFTEAAEVFKNAIKLDSNRPNVYSGLGNAQLKSGQTASAIASYRQALRLNPQKPFGVYKNLGDALRQEGKIFDAVAAYHQALNLKPNNKAVLRSLETIKNIRA